MNLRSMARRLGGALERATGADRLDLPQRSALLTEQIRAIIDTIPAVALGAVSMSLLVLWANWQTPVLPMLLIWAACLYLVLSFGIRTWIVTRRGEPRVASQRALGAASMNALVLGVIWGSVPILVLADASDTARMFVGMAIAGVLCGAGLALVVLPQAIFSFSIPVIGGTAIGLAGLENADEARIMIGMLAAFAGLLAIVSIRHARHFVRQRVSEFEIRQQKNIISLLLKEFEAHSSDWLWEFDESGRIIRVSDRFQSAAGKPRSQLVGVDFLAFLSALGSSNEQIVKGIETDIAQLATFADVEIMVGDGDAEKWWKLTGKPVFDDNDRYAGYIGTASDISAEKLAERRINFLAHNDTLTGLCNRARFTEHLKHCVARLERYGTPFTTLFLDLDQFKAVNDGRGHLVGDRLLVQVAQRIRGCVREADLAARLGGDEFAIILGHNAEKSEVADLAQRLIESIGKPYEIDGEIVSVGASIGIAVAPVNGTRPDQILRNADLALYRAKAEGRNTFRFFESQMDSDARERRMLELELREALKEEELVLYFQPLISTDDGRASGFEALVRWNHPIRGIVPPSEFIPIAEQSGLIKEIGDWTIFEACRKGMLWPREVQVAVNLSARHFQLSDIPSVVRLALSRTGLPAHRLELEITESLLIENPDDVIEKLRELKTIGVTIAMDDFGTGYSSLSYLLKFPFDKIKIDKSFVTASSEDSAARDILRSIASLGKTLKMRITAEGVETREQVEFLRNIACHQLQGYYFSRPLCEAEVARYFLVSFAGTDSEDNVVSIKKRR